MQDKKQNKRPDIPSIGADLSEMIGKLGPMTVADYMGAAVSHYYANKTALGEAGDFTTAPEISQMYGEMLGAWLVDVWLQMGQPDKVQLIELGPGRGTLMSDVMRTVSAWPAFKSAVTLHLVETSPQLRQAQATALKAWRPTWYDTLDEVPEGHSFYIANEFFDALPIHQFKKVKGEWKERRIAFDELERHFTYTTAEPDFDVGSVMPKEFFDAPDGSIYEVSPAALSILENIAGRIAEHGGAALICDYGHDAPALGDTLQSVSKHQYSDPLEEPGAKDITAHVDFSIFRAVGEQQVRVHGPVGQGDFLNGLGIRQRAQSLAENATDAQKKDIQLALYRLTSVGEMGRLFKVMGLSPKDSEITPAGSVMKYLTTKLDDIPWIAHGFFTRDGSDAAEITASLKLDKVVTLKQIHSATVIQLECHPERSEGSQVLTANAPGSFAALRMTEKSEGDAIITTDANIGIAVYTADCAPILFADIEKPIVAAAHAGWKGALSGVLENTVSGMKSRGCRRIVAAVGPCIAHKSYEVGLDFRAPFLAQDPANAGFFSAAARNGHLMFDLPGYVVSRLRHAGVAEIHETREDTLSNETRYFSHRRSTLRGEKNTGRQLSVIAIRD